MDFDGYVTMIEALGTGEKNTALEVRTFLSHLIQSIFLPGDIKMVYCTQEELLTDYDATGIGIGKRAGWGQCNGLGGRPAFGGRVPLGRNDTYWEIGARGGAERHTLTISEMPSHNHTMSNQSNGHNGSGKVTAGGENPEGNNPYTDNTGGGLSHNNMQPYIVVLYLIKLPNE